MNMIAKTIRRSICLASAGALAVGFGLISARSSGADDTGSPVSAANPVYAITRPSKESKLAFAAPGIVADVAATDGQVVKSGELLASQDTRQDEQTLKSMELEAGEKTGMEKIKYSQADAAMKAVQLKRKLELFHQNVATQSEIDEATLAVALADAQVKLAVLEHDQKVCDRDKQIAKLDQMHIKAPYDGIVEKVIVNTGEMADPQSRDGAIVIGQWDPLWVEMHLESKVAAQLKLGDSLNAKFDGDTDWKSAKIIFFEKVDAASDTQMVRLELPNPKNSHPAGLHVWVKLPDKAVAMR